MTHISLFEQQKETEEEMPVDRIRMCKECKRKFIMKMRNQLYCELHRNLKYRWHRLSNRREKIERKIERGFARVVTGEEHLNLPFYENEIAHTLLIDCEKVYIKGHMNNDVTYVSTFKFKLADGHRIKIVMGTWRSDLDDHVNHSAKVWYDDNPYYEFWIKRVYPLPQVSYSISNKHPTSKHHNLVKSIEKMSSYWRLKINSIGCAHET